MKNTNLSGGFTLIGELTAILIAVIVTTLVASGIYAAVRVYREFELYTKCRQFSTLLNLRLGDILRNAGYARTDGGEVWFRCDGSECRLDILDGSIVLVRGYEQLPVLDPNNGVHNGVSVSAVNLEYDSAEHAFVGSYTIENGGSRYTFPFVFRSVRSTGLSARKIYQCGYW